MSIRRNTPKNAASIQIRKDATLNSDRKQINLIPNKSFRYYKQYSLIIFRLIRIYLIIINFFIWFLNIIFAVVFKNFLLIDATDRSKISSDQKGFYCIKPTPFNFSQTLPLIPEVQFNPSSRFQIISKQIIHKTALFLMLNSKNMLRED